MVDQQGLKYAANVKRSNESVVDNLHDDKRSTESVENVAHHDKRS